MNTKNSKKIISTVLTTIVVISIAVAFSFVAIAPAMAVTPTGNFYKYADFTSSNSCFQGGYDVGGYVHSDGTEYLFVGNGQNCDMYKVVTDTSTYDIHSPPPNMAPRTLYYLDSYPYQADCGFSSGSVNEFIVTEDAVYLGPYHYSSGGQDYAKIYEWTIDWGTLDWTPVGFVVDAKLPQYYYTQTLGYDEEHSTFYTGTAGDRNVLSFQVGVDTDWQWEFTHTDLEGSHHDGLEYVAGKLWISDMTSAYIAEYEYTGTGSFNGWEEKNIFSYTGFPGYVEGMGFGPNQHFWATSGGNLFEVGGGDILPEIEDHWQEINKELDALKGNVSNATMPNIIKNRLIDKLEYAEELKHNAKEECEAGNFDAATKKLGVAKNEVESFASMVRITRRISSEDKESFLADAAEIIAKIDELIEYIETEQRC